MWWCLKVSLPSSGTAPVSRLSVTMANTEDKHMIVEKSTWFTVSEFSISDWLVPRLWLREEMKHDGGRSIRQESGERGP